MRVDKSVIVLFRQMNLFLNRELLDEKLTSSDVLYLALLYEQDGRTQDEMAEAYTVDRAATTRSLQGLEKKGLVRREVDTFDRRIRRVYLTEKAMQYRTAIRRMADDLADALFEGEKQVSELRFVFHSDFKYPIRVTMCPNRQVQQRPGVPAELMQDYDVELLRGGKVVKTIPVRGNHQRLNVLRFDATACDQVNLHCLSTNGAPNATVFEVRAYSEQK